MYQLYYYPLNASLAPHFVLEALGVEYQLCFVDRKSNAQKSSTYIRLNPTGRIPTLVKDKLAIFESAAICLWLAESHPEARLIPQKDTPCRAEFHQWLMYLTSTLQAELMIYFYPEKLCPIPQAIESISQNQQNKITDCLRTLNQALDNKQYLVADQLSVCDYFLLMLLIWADELDTPPLKFENLKRFLHNMFKKPSIARVCEVEGIDLAPYQSSIDTITIN